MQSSRLVWNFSAEHRRESKDAYGAAARAVKINPAERLKKAIALALHRSAGVQADGT